VTRLTRGHAADEVRAYQGNLLSVVHAVQNGWLPREHDADTEQHLESLRRYLAKSGQPVNDSFLLRFGLTVPGTQRGIVPPLMVLDSNRGGFSDRRQSEAAGQIIRLREALAIGRRLVPSLSLDTQTAVAQLADLCRVQPVLTDRDLFNLFNDLSDDEAEQLADRAIDFLDSNEKSTSKAGKRILERLACFSERPISESTIRALMERRIFWPSSLYRDSGDASAVGLISLIDETADRLLLHHLLLALAWTRSAPALKAFRQWSDQPPAWASQLHVAPADYLPSAGYCLGANGQRRDLINLRCFRLIPIEEASGRDVLCRVRIDDRCPACGSPLGWLFDFSALPGAFFPGEFADAPRKVLCCLRCSSYGPVFTTYHADGTSEWLSGNESCEFPYVDERGASIRKVDDSPCAPFACAEPFSLDDASTLGGIPMWLQYAEFPRCIECNRYMTFLAQHDNSPLGEEGIYYAFFCSQCHIAAVTYQQT
jgi:hypothetical protein